MKSESDALNGVVRVEASSSEAAVRAFVDGVLAALVASNEPVTVREGSATRVDIEIALTSRKRAIALATSVATMLKSYCADARVTLVTDVSAVAEEVLRDLEH
jgi:hypothetical protein